ncbi:MAG: beta-ketoacyl synthase N-terminal-like domain-containing protein, partial [Byssovorax sp.]
MLIAESDGARIRRGRAPATAPRPRSRPPRRTTEASAQAEESCGALVARCIAGALKMEPHELDPERAFSEYGLDSLTGVELVTQLNRELRVRLRTTVLYDHGNLDALVAHLDALPEVRDRQRRTATTAAPRSPLPRAPLPAPAPAPAIHLAAAPSRRESPGRDVAVIGMSGRYPGAPDLDAYWRLLAEGRCAIREIPPERWGLDGFYDPVPGRKDRSYCRSGGFLEGIDRFDPAFFRISRAEAEQTDPQQRLFLQEAWRTIEDAGYTAERLGRADCGVVAGGMDGDYQSKLIQAGAREAQALWGNDSSVIAARVAYFLDLRGPSIILNTACSSSLTAIHLACQRIRAGESETMLAGASFLLGPTFHRFASEVGMLSPSGICRAFDNRADGFVPGEGVGLVMLKALDAALRDGDVIHGIIRGSGINQDGRTNGITAPSAAAQTELELRVYRDFEIDPATISYVETHGTGTKLGDPIEIEALTRAFRRTTDRRRFCPIGSVKTNIGHAAIASGIASVHKVLLAMRHRTLPPSLHFAEPNEHIDFEGSPFYVNTASVPWEPPAGEPRRAAISGFGMSGTNAHLVLEEPPPGYVRKARPRPFHLFPFSARTPAALDRLLSQLEDFLAAAPPALEASNLSWTLQVGRTPFPVRAAFVAESLAELRHRIQRFRAGDAHQGRSRDLKRDPVQKAPERMAGLEALCAKLSGEARLDILRDGLHELAAAFVDGYALPWGRLQGGGLPTRVPLPTYPFEQVRCWIPNRSPDPPDASPAPSPPAPPAPPAADRMLLRTTRLSSGEARIETQLEPSFSFLDDHRIHGARVLPGTAYLEIARAAGEQLTGRVTTGIRDLVWSRPLTVGESACSASFAWRKNAPEGAFEMVNEAGERPQVHATGRLVWDAPAKEERLDVAEVRRRCVALPTGAALYSRFEALGLSYGPSFQVIQELAAGHDEAFARLEPAPQSPRDSSLYLVPSLLDGALQALIGLASPDAVGGTPFVPFMLEAFDIHGPVRGSSYAHVVREKAERADMQRFTIRVYDLDGQPRAVLRGLHVRQLITRPSPTSLLWCRPAWEAAPLQSGALPDGAVLLLGHADAEREALRERLQRPVVLVTPGEGALAPSRWPALGAVVSLWPDLAGDLDAPGVLEPLFRLVR